MSDLFITRFHCNVKENTQIYSNFGQASVNCKPLEIATHILAIFMQKLVTALVFTITMLETQYTLCTNSTVLTTLFSLIIAQIWCVVLGNFVRI